MKKIRIGAIGACSAIFCNVHGDGILNNPDKFELVALCDLNKEKLAKDAVRFHVSQTYEDYREMIAKANLDAVVNATPTSSHAVTTIDCLNAGLHVICEKPISMTIEEADAMIDAAKKNNKILQIAVQSRHCDAWKKIRDLIRAGRIGTPHTITITQFWDDPYVYKNWRAAAEISGGGIVADSSIHWIDMMRNLMGEITGVFGIGTPSPDSPMPDLEDSSLSLFRFQSGAIGCLRNGWRNVRWPNCNENVEINGTVGTIIANLMNPWVRNDPQIVELFRVGGNPVEKEVFEFMTSRDRFTAQMADFAECVNGNRLVTCTAEDARRGLQIQQAIYDSYKTKKWIEI